MHVIWSSTIQEIFPLNLEEKLYPRVIVAKTSRLSKASTSHDRYRLEYSIIKKCGISKGLKDEADVLWADNFSIKKNLNISK